MFRLKSKVVNWLYSQLSTLSPVKYSIPLRLSIFLPFTTILVTASSSDDNFSLWSISNVDEI